MDTGKREKRIPVSSRKFTQLVDTAEALFQRHGLQRVSVEEICLQAGVSKMTFYKYFSNKTDLAKHIIDRIMTHAEVRYREIMDGEAPFREKMKELIVMKMEKAEEFSFESMGELYRNPSPEIACMLQKRAEINLKMLLDDFSQAQARGELHSKIRPELILFTLNRMMDWISDETFLEMFDSLPSLTSELIHLFFYGILGCVGKEAAEK